jgi:hypothetical protein
MLVPIPVPPKKGKPNRKGGNPRVEGMGQKLIGTAWPLEAPKSMFRKKLLAEGMKKKFGSTNGGGKPKPVIPGVPKDVFENPPGMLVGPKPVSSGNPPPFTPPKPGTIDIC